MINGIVERGLNKDSNSVIKLRKHPGVTSIDILDHVKPSLRRQSDKLIVHAGTNDTTNNINYLKNVKKIVKLTRETSKNTAICFSSLICRTDVQEANEKINKINTNLKNYCNQQNIGFIDNSNVTKLDLTAKGLHLKERGSSKLANNFLNYLS